MGKKTLAIDVTDCKTISDLEAVGKKIEISIQLYQEKLGQQHDIEIIKQRKKTFGTKVDYIRSNPTKFNETKKAIKTIVKDIVDRMNPLEEMLEKGLNELLDEKKVLEGKRTTFTLESLSEEYSKEKEAVRERVQQIKSEQEACEKQVKQKEDLAEADGLALRETVTVTVGYDEKERLENRKVFPKGEQELDRLLIKLLEGKIKEYTDEIKEYVSCADKRQINALIIFSITKTNEKLFGWVLNGINANFQDKENNSLLLLSIQNPCYKIFAELIGRGTKIDDPRLLYAAAENGKIDICELLLKNNAKINLGCKRYDKIITPIEIASECGHPQIVELLKSKGANTNNLNLYEAFAAIKKADIDKLKSLLLLLGDAANDKDSHGFTLLQKAVIQENEQICKLLLTHGVSISELSAPLENISKDISGETLGCLTALSYAVDNNENLNIAKLLLQYGAYSASYGKDGKDSEKNKGRVLYRSVFRNSIELCRLLINALSLVEKKQIINYKVITVCDYKAAAKDHVINYRLTATALYCAAERGELDIATLLIDNGAEVDCICKSNDITITPIEIASECGHPQIVKLLKSKGANTNNLNLYEAFRAIKKGSIDELTRLIRLLQLRIVVNGRNSEDCTLLQKAISEKKQEMCKLLLDYGADPDCYYTDYYDHKKQSALMMAVSKDDQIICQLLITNLPHAKKAIVINYQYENKTALYFAAEKGNAQICEYLLTEGADISLGITNKFGSKTTPFEIAIEKGHTEVVSIMQKIRNQAKNLKINSEEAPYQTMRRH